MNKIGIAIKVYGWDYNGFAKLGDIVLDRLTDNPDFAGITPPLSVLSDDLDAVKAAIIAWTAVDKRGSRAVLADLRVKTTKLSQTLKALSESVHSMAQIACGSDYLQMAEMLSTSGFPLAASKMPQGKLNQVQNLRRVFLYSLGINQFKLKWSRPQDVTSPANVKLYKIYKAPFGSAFSEAEVLDTTSKTTFIYTNNLSVMEKLTFWIVAVSAAGDGNGSNPVSVTVLSD